MTRMAGMTIPAGNPLDDRQDKNRSYDDQRKASRPDDHRDKSRSYDDFRKSSQSDDHRDKNRRATSSAKTPGLIIIRRQEPLV